MLGSAIRKVWMSELNFFLILTTKEQNEKFVRKKLMRKTKNNIAGI